MSTVTRTEHRSRLELARAAHDAIVAKLDDINAERVRVENNASASPAVGAASTLRQQRTGLLARLLRLGPVEATPESKALDRELARAEDAERQAAAIAEARDTVLAELQVSATDLIPTLAVARREVAEAQFAEAGDDITRRLVPAYRAAVDQMVAAHAALAGGGKAHWSLARELHDDHGVTTGARGQENPPVGISIAPPIGFDITSGPHFNRLDYELQHAVDAGRADALNRWRAR